MAIVLFKGTQSCRLDLQNHEQLALSAGGIAQEEEKDKFYPEISWNIKIELWKYWGENRWGPKTKLRSSETGMGWFVWRNIVKLKISTDLHAMTSLSWPLFMKIVKASFIEFTFTSPTHFEVIFFRWQKFYETLGSRMEESWSIFYVPHINILYCPGLNRKNYLMCYIN